MNGAGPSDNAKRTAQIEVEGEGERGEKTPPVEDFYAASLEAQGQIEAYLIAYAAALSDRKGELEKLRQHRVTSAA